jgi:hypothetical protein
MRTWAEELKSHTHDYVRRGGKQNRKKQVSLIIDFLEYTDSQEKITSLHRLGSRHVINFWKSHRNLSEKTAYDYWLGICKLWEWIGKPDKPPKPHKMSEPTDSHDSNIELVFSEFSKAIKSARELKGLSIQKLANLSGCEAMVVNEIEAGKYDGAKISEVQNLLSILNIQLSIRIQS